MAQTMFAQAKTHGMSASTKRAVLLNSNPLLIGVRGQRQRPDAAGVLIVRFGEWSTRGRHLSRGRFELTVGRVPIKNIENALKFIILAAPMTPNQTAIRRIAATPPICQA